MLEATLHHGEIIPLGPIPSEWKEGVILQIDKVIEPPQDVDAWAKMLNESSSNSTQDDQNRMLQAIEQHRQQAKILARIEMGLSS